MLLLVEIQAMGDILQSVNLRGGLLWFQFAYSIWQFFRVAKYFRLPYAFLAHTFMWLIGKWGCPFASRSYIVLEQGRTNFYVPPHQQQWILERLDSTVVEDLIGLLAMPSNLRCLHIKAANYKLCGTRYDIDNNFVWNYLRDNPDCFAVTADLLWPGFAILDRISVLDGLKMMCQGGYIPGTRTTRFLAVPDRERELNQNFTRVLATIPLMAQAKGYDSLSLWLSIAIIVTDQCSLLFNKAWVVFKKTCVHLFKIVMLKLRFQPRTRELICTFFSTFSKQLMFSDQIRRNFVQVKKGDTVYTKSPFNLADFEFGEPPRLESTKKQPRPYNVAEFGIFRDSNGETHEFAAGTSVWSYCIDDSRVDVIFMKDGEFYNYVNNVAVHLGYWCSHTDLEKSPENFDDFLDLLQIMEEMQMLPICQTAEDQLQSLDYNMLFFEGSSPRDLTFLVAKNGGIIGG